MTEEVDKKTVQKRFFPREKTLAYCASSYRAWQTSSSILLGCTRSSINYCSSNNIISVTPKRLLKENFLKKRAISTPQ